jgi:AcrR family transcriptional regulator
MDQNEPPPGSQRAGRRLLGRPERRAQLIHAAAAAFIDKGFAATSLVDVATEAGVTRMIIYRHFESKRDLYLAVLLDTRARILDHLGPRAQFDSHTVADLAQAAAAHPDGFRLLYRHAQREPEFAGYANELTTLAADTADTRLRELIPDTARRRWIAALLPAIINEAILTWLDAEQPIIVDELADTINATTRALTQAAASHRPQKAPEN